MLMKLSDDYAVGGGTGFDCRPIEELIDAYHKNKLKLCEHKRRDHCEVNGYCEMILNKISHQKELVLRRGTNISVVQHVASLHDFRMEAMPEAQKAWKKCREVLLNITLAEVDALNGKQEKKVVEVQKLPLPAQFRRVVKPYNEGDDQ